MTDPLKRQSALRVKSIIQIRLANAIAYAQCTNRHPMFGPLVRVISRRFAQPTDDFKSLVESDSDFSTFLVWDRNVDPQLATIVGSANIPDRYRGFPLLRSSDDMFNEPGKTRRWYVWDGERTTCILRLTDDFRALSLRQFWSVPLLAARIEQGWRPLR